MKRAVIILFILAAFTSSAQDYKLEGNEVKTGQPVLFEAGSAKLKPESDAALKIIKNYLDDKSYISLVRVECHTDNSNNATANQTLTEKRAYAVCTALVAMGVDCKRLLPVGFGGTKPVDDNSTVEGRAANSRVNFINAAIRGHLIGGMPADGGGVVAGDICTQ